MSHRILIGKTEGGQEVYEFEKQNPEFDNTGNFRLMDLFEVEEELIKRNIDYIAIQIQSVFAHDFLVITLKNGDKYALDLFITSNYDSYVTMSSFYIFCQNYFGTGYDFYGV